MELIIQDTEKSLIKRLPETVKISEFETVRTGNQKAIITEYEGKIAIGYSADVARRVITVTSEKSLSVTESRETVGEYEYIPEASTLHDIVNTINGLVDLISSKLFGKDN